MLTIATPTAAAPVDELSWEDIEEEVSMATGTMKLTECITMVIIL